MSYLVFDSETQIHKSHKRTANPWHPDNYVVLRGWKKQGDTECSADRFTGKTPDNYLRISEDVKVLVGHNIKFDLLYEMVNNNPDLKAFFQRGGRIWDTQLAKYLIEGQDQKYHMNAMDKVAPEYGGTNKVDGVKELWKAGVQTADIDEDLLLGYLIGFEDEGRNGGDIRNTELMFLGQVQEAHELGMLKAIGHRMDSLLCTTEMEFRGIKVDVAVASRNLKELEARLEDATERLNEYTKDIPAEVGFNWGSRTHTSCIIFGGTIKYKKSAQYNNPDGTLARKIVTESWPLFDGEPVDPRELCKGAEPIVTDDVHHWEGQDTFAGGKKKGLPKFRNVKVQGEPKTKIQEFLYPMEGYTTPDKEWKTKNTDGAGKPLYQTGTDVIERLANRDIPFLKALGELTALNKEIGTYYLRYDEKKKEHVGMLTCVQKTDHIVHHSLNHTSTKTGRLSANNPNCQNIPRGDKSKVKEMFVSRFGDDGMMIEADYSQLEVVGQAVLSLDKALIKDLIGGIDFHCKRVALKNNVSYEFALLHCKDEDADDHAKWKKERTGCKIFSFQRAYGAGAALIAESTGMGVEEVKELIKAEEKEYSGIVEFNAAVEQEVNDTADVFRDPVRGFRVFRKGTYQTPTGTIYGFRSYDAPSFLQQKGVTDTFKPTELKNYPVQGFSGELVQMILGKLWRHFVANDNYGGRAVLVNTVHDCIWVDCHKDVLDTVCKDIKRIMESIPEILENDFGIPCPVPFPVDVEAGKNMLDLHHVAL